MTPFAELSKPFPAKDVEWRIQKKSKDGKKALVIAYHDARTVMDRLDQAVGPANWQDAYRGGAAGGVICRLELRMDGEWIGKEDAAENTNVEAVKGGISDAFKRAGVKWGIGRYLYDVPATWVTLKNEYGDFDPPRLPQWALPTGDTSVARAAVDTETGEIFSEPQGEMASEAMQAAARAVELPPIDAAPTVKVAAGVPEWWPIFRALKNEKHVTDAALEMVIGAGPSLAEVSAWLEANPDKNFAQLVTLAEGQQKQLMGAR
jgi:hypothetical protein